MIAAEMYGIRPWDRVYQGVSIADGFSAEEIEAFVAGKGEEELNQFYLEAQEAAQKNIDQQALENLQQEEIDLAVTFSDQAALAIENARLRGRVEENAALAERSRLARELHDSVTQSLYSVTLYAEAAARLLTAGKGAEAASHLRELRDTALEALREMRLLIFQLRLPALEKSGLAGALQARMDAVESRLGIHAEMRLEGLDLASRVPFSVQQELYYVAHEALNNVLRHARAAHVIVGLKFEEAVVSLQIEDDGIGFTPQTAVQGGGLGLDGMLERAKRVGGELTMESQSGSGTRIAIRVPLIMPQVEAER